MNSFSIISTFSGVKNPFLEWKISKTWKYFTKLSNDSLIYKKHQIFKFADFKFRRIFRRNEFSAFEFFKTSIKLSLIQEKLLELGENSSKICKKSTPSCEKFKVSMIWWRFYIRQGKLRVWTKMQKALKIFKKIARFFYITSMGNSFFRNFRPNIFGISASAPQVYSPGS